MAAELSTDADVTVQTVKGGFGEFSVSIDGEKVIKPSRLGVLRPSKVVAKARSLLAETR